MKPLAAIWCRGIVAALAVTLCLMTGGCVEAVFTLSPSSEIPPQWKNDPRTKAWKGYRIEYWCYTDETVVAHVCPVPRQSSGCFTVRGDDGPEPHVVKPLPGVQYGYFRFNGITERYEFQYPDPDPRVIGVTLRLLRKDEHTGILPPVNSTRAVGETK